MNLQNHGQTRAYMIMYMNMYMKMIMIMSMIMRVGERKNKARPRAREASGGKVRAVWFEIHPLQSTPCVMFVTEESK